MRVLNQAWLITLLALALAACTDPRSGENALKDKAVDQSPEVLVPSQIGWFVSNGGISLRDQGMFIDIADGGSLIRFVKRTVSEEQRVELIINLDASGDQSLSTRISEGCADPSNLPEYEAETYLKNGQNRIAASHNFGGALDCFAVHLVASNGPVSVFIEDATVYWRE